MEVKNVRPSNIFDAIRSSLIYISYRLGNKVSEIGIVGSCVFWKDKQEAKTADSEFGFYLTTIALNQLINSLHQSVTTIRLSNCRIQN